MAKTKAKRKPLPKKLYCWREKPDEKYSSNYIYAYDTKNKAAPRPGKTRKVGVYELVKKITLTTKIAK